MDVVLLGTGSPMIDPRRAGPSTLVRAGGTSLLFDAGRGVLLRLAAVGAPPQTLAAVVLTHMHSDHITDLNDVITSQWIMTQAPTPLAIYGPKGVAALVDATLKMLTFDVGYRIAHHDDLNEGPQVVVTELEPGDTVTIGACQLTAEATDHSPVSPTLGYRVTCGKAIVAIAGDTIPCPGLDAICANADVYVQTVIREDLVKRVPVQRFQDILDYHSTVEQAGQTAAANGVKTLMLTHYVPPLQPGQEDEWRALAAAHFKGEIVLGDDLTSVSVTE
jgi:ribonuclease Z